MCRKYMRLLHILCMYLAFTCELPLLSFATINNGNVPFTISNAGIYIVVEDISYTAAAATPAIIINSNDVVLDLLNYSVSQVGGLSFSVTGVQIAANLSNITVKNGVLSGLTQSGISAASGATLINLNTMKVTN